MAGGLSRESLTLAGDSAFTPMDEFNVVWLSISNKQAPVWGTHINNVLGILHHLDFGSVICPILVSEQF